MSLLSLRSHARDLLRELWNAPLFIGLALGACADAGEGPTRDVMPLEAGPGGDEPSQRDAEIGQEPESNVDDAGSQVRGDGSTGESGCELGAAGSFATDQTLDLFGEVIYFARGQELPKGRYRAAYEDGCMKYNNIFQWTVNGSATDGWWLVGVSESDRVALLPGTSPKLIFDGFSEFEACVTANRALASIEFEFEGGKLGIWLNDSPYQDNQAGENGRNPKWSLTLLEEKCPPDLVIF